jgi:fibronectin type 3 domain-containing protein
MKMRNEIVKRLCIGSLSILERSFKMNNTIKFLGIIALVAVIGFTMTACDGLFGDDDEGDDTAVTFSSVTANGNIAQTTTQLTLTFSQAITGLSASNITLTLNGVSNVSKGTLSGSGSTYTLPISGFTSGGLLTVVVTKSGYAISGSTKTVTIFYYRGAPGAPNTPTGVSAAAVSSSSITVSWTPVLGATGYTVYRSSSATGIYAEVGTTTVLTMYTDTGLTAATTYYYQVTAKNANGESARSAPASAATNTSSGGTTLPTSYHGTWVSTTGDFQPYTLTVSATTIKWEDKYGDFVQHANVQFTAAANTDSTFRTQYPNGYTFTGTKTNKNHNYEVFFFILLSADGQRVYLGYDAAEAFDSYSNGSIYTKSGGGGTGLPAGYHGTWVYPEDLSYTLTVSATTVRLASEDNDFIQYANAQFTLAANTNSANLAQFPNGYTFTGTKTNSNYWDDNYGFIALSADGQSVYLAENAATAGFIFTKNAAGTSTSTKFNTIAAYSSAVYHFA